MMSIKRMALVFKNDAKDNLKRPLFWILILIIGLTCWGLSSGFMRIQSGDSDVGGTKAFITSEFSNAMFICILSMLYYSFFISIGTGMSLIKDDELEVGQVLHSTPLKAGEYIWGKFLAPMACFIGVLVLHMGLAMFFNHVVAGAKEAEIIGPLSVWAYFRPAMIFALPGMIFIGGVSFFLGERFKKPILVFSLPLGALLFCIFFLWDFSPHWLSPFWNNVMMLADPAGIRWLDETYLNVDRGTAFYNSATIALDTPFLLSRLAFIAVGLGAVFMAQRHFSKTLRGLHGKPSKAGQEEIAEDKTWRSPNLGALKMTANKPGFIASAWTVARFELGRLLKSPGMYLFIPLIVLEAMGVFAFALGPFDTPMLLTPGNMAMSTMNILTMLVTILLMFYTVESLRREANHNLHQVFYATPTKTPALLFGKALANSLVGVLIISALLLTALVFLLVQQTVPISITPFMLVWGGLLFPTFLVWTSFVSFLYSVTNSRYTTYGLALGMLIWTTYERIQGDLTWVTNWLLWSSERWTDIGVFELNRSALIMNRLLALSLTALFIALTIRFFPRRSWDATRIIHRLKPKSLGWATLSLAPFLLITAGLGIGLSKHYNAGFQGEALEDAGKKYWRKNHATFIDYPLPAITHIKADVTLDPDNRNIKVNGHYILRNDTDKPMARFPLTQGGHYENLAWTLSDEAYETDDRQGLHLIKPEQSLRPGGTLKLGFSFEGSFPKGVTKNGGGVGEFVLPSGVVLTSFSPSFLPSMGYNEGIGVDKDNAYESKDFEEGFFEGDTPSAFGQDQGFTTHMTIRGPERFQYNGVGVKTREEVNAGIREVVWQTDYPVTFCNIVAGKWEVLEGEGTALYYHKDHHYNVEEMMQAMNGARKYFSEWFYEYPWETLKVSEFPNLAGYAQGFATNITFSEGIGFLTKSNPRTSAAFMVTTHESAHQWWGNLLNPGRGPGGNILSEGMAHFSTAMLIDQVKGEYERQSFLKNIEDQYGERRRSDSERPLVWNDGSRPGDTTVTYDKGGWTAWMLMQHMGRDNMLEGLQAFIQHYHGNVDHPVMFDFVSFMRDYAPDQDAYDAFTEQWYKEVVVPQYSLEEVTREEIKGSWKVSFTVKNTGTSTMPVVLALHKGDKFDLDEDDDKKPATLNEEFQESRTEVILGAGESKVLSITSDFEPTSLVIDPDVSILMLKRKLALHEFKNKN